MAVLAQPVMRGIPAGLFFDHSRLRESRSHWSNRKQAQKAATGIAAKEVTKFELCLLDSPEGSDFVVDINLV